MKLKYPMISMLSLGLMPTAQSEGLSVGLLGVASLQDPSYEKSGKSATVKGKTSFGAGLSSEIVMANGIGIEVDLLLLSHKFTRDTVEIFGVSASSTFASSFVQIPVLVRYRPIPYLNLGLGPYYSRVVSAWSVSAADFSKTEVNYGKNDFGFVAAVGSFIPANDMIALTVDLRYNQSLSNTATESKEVLKFSTLQGLVGLRFGIQ